jgi:asparagine synthase (glutamine-hydrolysing)
MCGITGVYAFNENGKGIINKLDASVATLGKRGPDSHGKYLHKNVGLGHTRLSIIDVSDSASQPFSDATGRYMIIFNGEIFNFQSLKAPLIEKGIKFQSQSDTEVLLYLYITEGAGFLNKLNGFFAFAIYDNAKESLFIARDRMGVKPLLVYRDEDKVLFASEMKALLAYGIPKDIDYVSLNNYLQLNYIPAPETIFKGVKKLRPGSYMIINNEQLIINNYYEIPYNEKNLLKVSYDEAQKEIVRLLDSSVERRLISDVPLGAFLSGGIDSSVIVALASQYTKHLNTFSIGFKDEPMFDETQYSRLVAKQYNTNHTEFSLTTDDTFAILQNVLDYTDEPYADSSALAVYILSMHTRKHVTVALSGDGADELLGGYNKHFAEYKVRQKGFLNSLIKYSPPIWDLMPQSRNSFLGNKMRQISRYAQGLKLEDAERYWRWCAFVDEADAEKMMIEPLDRNEYLLRKRFATRFIDNRGGMNNVLYSDMHLVLQNDMLTKVDLMSMANSLEVRTPFLDYELVNYAFSLPSEYKINSSMRKAVLKDAFRGMLPEELYHRGKHGFEVPLLKWFRTELKGLIMDDLLSDDFIVHQNIFNLAEIQKLKRRLFSNNPGDVHAQIWGLIVFQTFWKKINVEC